MARKPPSTTNVPQIMKLNNIYIESHKIPMAVEQAAKLILRHFNVVYGYEFWAFMGICSRDCVTILEIKNASLRGQLKGLHRARRTREKELEEQVEKLKQCNAALRAMNFIVKYQRDDAKMKLGRIRKFTP